MKEEISDSELWATMQAEIRDNLDTAQSCYAFLDELDMDGPEVLGWNMKRKIQKAKKAAVRMICEGIHLLEFSPPDEEDE